MILKDRKTDDALKARKETLSESPSMHHAKLIVIERHLHKLSLGEFIQEIDKYLLPRYRRMSVVDFASFMQSLEEMGIRVEVMDEVLDQYVSSTTNESRALGTVIANIISRNLEVGDVAHADHWIDYYCEKVAAAKSSDDAHDASPFTTYIRGMSMHMPPTQDFSPIVAKMSQACVWPDTAFINTLLQAELRRDRATQALALYEVLRRHGDSNRALTPNTETFGSLFEAFRRLSRRQRQVWKRDQATMHAGDGSGNSPLTPWNVFRDMVYRQRQILSSDGEQQPNVMSTRSLKAALRMFVETSDYTCAIAALSCFAEFRIPLVDPRSTRQQPHPDPDGGTANVIINTLVNRCRSELGPRRSNNVLPTWTDLFLDLKDGERRVLMHLPRSATQERVLDLAARPVDYERYPALRSFIVTDERSPSESLPPGPECDDDGLGELQKGWKTTQLRDLSTLLHHAVVAEANLALVNTERPEDVLLRMLGTQGQQSAGSKLFR